MKPASSKSLADQILDLTSAVSLSTTAMYLAEDRGQTERAEKIREEIGVLNKQIAELSARAALS